MSNHPDSIDNSDTSFEDESRLGESHWFGSPNGPPKSRVKAGAKRGRYNRVAAGAKKRIIDCYLTGGDWKLAATSNG